MFIKQRDRYKEELLEIDESDDVMEQLMFIIQKVTGTLDQEDPDLEYEIIGKEIRSILKTKSYGYLLEKLELQSFKKNLLVLDEFN